MSSMVSQTSSDFATEVMTPDGGLEVTGQLDEENIIEIEGDAKLGIIAGNLTDTITTGAGDAGMLIITTQALSIQDGIVVSARSGRRSAATRRRRWRRAQGRRATARAPPGGAAAPAHRCRSG